MKRGDVYWAVLEPRSGSEQKGRRPVILFSHDIFHLSPSWFSLIVVPITTSVRQSKRTPTIVEIPGELFGASRNGIALCHQITTLDRRKFERRIGTLTPAMLERVGHGVKAALDLE